MSEHLLLRLAKQNSSREMYSPIRHIKKIKNTSAFLTPDGDLVSKALVFFIFFMCRRIGEYISLELFRSGEVGLLAGPRSQDEGGRVCVRWRGRGEGWGGTIPNATLSPSE